MSETSASPTHSSSIPPLRRHRRKDCADRAYVVLDGERVYLGVYGAPETNRAYVKLIAEYEATGFAEPPPTDLTIVELAAKYLEYADDYYRRVDDRSPTGEAENIEFALKSLPRKCFRAEREGFCSRSRS